jgi:lipopolysaccharide transport system ATP-binding protein
MQVRLAFSVATAYRPDILIVDEALSVGDTYFQHKSFERIKQFQKQGTTLLFVSHDKGAIQAICDRAVLLNNGSIAMQGQPEAVMDYYNAMLADKQNQSVTQTTTEDGRTQTISGTGEARVEEIKLLDENGNSIEVVDVGQMITLSVDIKSKNNLKNIVFGYLIKDRLGQDVFGTNTHHLNKIIPSMNDGDTINLQIAFNANLGAGTYSVTVAVHTDENHMSNSYVWIDLALIFSVININKPKFVGCNYLSSNIFIESK